MALCLLGAEWAAQRGGRAVALTVDHALRPESGREARQVGTWLAARGIEGHILRWRGEKPERGIPAAARLARYGLLTRWCRSHRVLHLLLAHHLEDQAETLLLRLGRGSGVDGLAAMAQVSESAGVGLLRPLIAVPKGRLVATLDERRQAWVRDPTNLDPAYRRVRVRRALDMLAPEGLSPPRLAATARRLGRARVALEAATVALLTDAVTIHPAGFCRLDPGPLVAAPPEIALRALGRVVMCVGAGLYPVRLERLERLYGAFTRSGLEAARTLAGCRILPWRRQVLICREPAAAAEVLELRPGGRGLWDHRFAVRLARGAAMARRFSVRRLGRAGWTEIAARRPDLRQHAIPAAVRPSLPSLWVVDGVVSVPHLQYCRDGAEAGGRNPLAASLRPVRALSPPPFGIV